jgi:hypothetical protein
MSNGDVLLALTLGLGGGLALAYLRRHDEASGTDSAQAAPAKPAPDRRNCSVRLDASGLRADGYAVDVPRAVAWCKAAGGAELFFAKDGPAAVYADLHQALSHAGIPFRVSGGRVP